MFMVVQLLLLTVLLELAMYIPILWRARIFIAGLLAFAIPVASVSVVIDDFSWLSCALLIVSGFRVFNLLRIAKARMHKEYLVRASRRTSVALTGGSLLLIVVINGLLPGDYSLNGVAQLFAALQVIVALGLVVTTVLSLRGTRYKQGDAFYSDKELPTVSLLIPARNETNDLEECLRSALATDYPKLEIIVLDDCSQLRTSEIIKGFAHKGVRFIKGEAPADRWLAKNQAYEHLRKEASGSVLLFCGVDVRFGPHAIKALVTEFINRDKDMISVLPHRLSGSLAGAFIQPMRYWWELSLPRKLVNRPPVLSTCWVISKKRLAKLGGFGSVSHSIAPEAVFARETIVNNKYSFIRADDTLDIQTRKSYEDQRSTAIRTRYPQLRKRPENVLLLVAAELSLLLGPFIGLAYGIINGLPVVTALSAAASVLLILNHLLIVQSTSPANVAVALCNLPVEVITTVVISLVSMVRYELGTVNWKDRNVCIPVMHVIPHLPKLD